MASLGATHPPLVNLARVVVGGRRPHWLLEGGDSGDEHAADQSAANARPNRDGCHRTAGKGAADGIVCKVATQRLGRCKHCLGDDHGGAGGNDGGRESRVRLGVEPGGGSGDLKHKDGARERHANEGRERTGGACIGHDAAHAVRGDAVGALAVGRADEAAGDHHRGLRTHAEAERGREEGEQQDWQDEDRRRVAAGRVRLGLKRSDKLRHGVALYVDVHQADDQAAQGARERDEERRVGEVEDRGKLGPNGRDGGLQAFGVSSAHAGRARTKSGCVEKCLRLCCSLCRGRRRCCGAHCCDQRSCRQQWLRSPCGRDKGSGGLAEENA